MKTPYVVGISGGSGSGKTRVLSWLQGLLSPDTICLFSQDNYYRDGITSSLEEMRRFNFDDPDVIDVEAFAKDLSLLKKGLSIQRQEYHFNDFTRESSMLEYHPAPVIVVEGIFIFHYPEIREQLDLKVFVEVKEHLKFQRRIARDTSERGYLLEDILYKYTHHVAPAYEKYIEPYRHAADVIIPNNHSFEEECPPAIQVLGTYLKTKLI
ncbi:uridine kinase family protein [Catalinimonas niigatensis]|uniref:uridine kinase family protein n=1 Tax=Catalinimonas niigatensis TaxID=1397264 RepID=UPI002666C970|nr:uridine kinase [Catalinimonas niigatensis]WPP48393.1 uridine kinase [Catalinimonas niigatensis]